MKIVINSCFGGFGLSYKAVMEYARLKGIELYPFISEGFGKQAIIAPYVHVNNYDAKKRMFPLIHYSVKPVELGKNPKNKDYFSADSIKRDDPVLVEVVERLKGLANGDCAELKIVSIPDDVDWEISEYDGQESVEEKHRSWG